MLSLAKGYSVLILDGGLDTSVVSMLEQKLEKSRFTRVDADIIDRLIVKEESKESTLSEDERKGLTETFNAKLPTLDKTTITVEVTPMGETGAPAVLTQNEYMRRMKDISRYQSGMGFYQQMPDTYTLVLNSDNETIKAILADANGKEDTIEQIIDLALLQTGLLKGAALDKFIKRSYKLTK
ncbi:MAG: hypothetical protein IIZ88_00400 [Prevotella sp.]|nr:hypothetical protein [Prevotella sp.]